MKNRFVEIRKHFDLTQVEFGERLGVSRSVIANIEYGKVAPTALICKLVCREFDINQYWLETGQGEMFNEVDDVSKAVSFYMSALKGGSSEDEAFKKVFVSELAGVLDAIGPDGWQKLKQLIVNTYEAQRKEKEPE